MLLWRLFAKREEEMKIATIGLFAALFLVGTALWHSPPAQTQGAGPFAIVSSSKAGPFNIVSSSRRDAAFRLNVATGQVHYCQVKASSYGRDVEGSCTALATE